MNAASYTTPPPFLTKEILETLLKPDHVKPFSVCVSQPSYLDTIRNAASKTQIDSPFGTIRLQINTHQVAKAWMFSDSQLANDFLEGRVTEQALLRRGNEEIDGKRTVMCFV